MVLVSQAGSSYYVLNIMGRPVESERAKKLEKSLERGKDIHCHGDLDSGSGARRETSHGYN